MENDIDIFCGVFGFCVGCGFKWGFFDLVVGNLCLGDLWSVVFGWEWSGDEVVFMFFFFWILLKVFWFCLVVSWCCGFGF